MVDDALGHALDEGLVLRGEDDADAVSNAAVCARGSPLVIGPDRNPRRGRQRGPKAHLREHLVDGRERVGVGVNDAIMGKPPPVEREPGNAEQVLEEGLWGSR